ncbi:MAG TPA: response regulator [Microvirga sp.]|nr:response regulator [Microvirga sp.]
MLPEIPSPGPGARPCCLLVEDQVLVALSLEAFLDESGWAVAGPLSTRADALLWLKDRRPDLAIVDFELRDGICTPLLMELKARGVPFIIYSGHRPSAESLPPEVRDAVWLEKPTARQALLRAVEAVTADPRRAYALPR